MTLQFLGDVEENEIPKLCQLIREIAESGDYKIGELHLSGIGCFPNDFAPRVVYVAVESEGLDALKSLQNYIANKLAYFGFEVDSRSWKAHITLARIREGSDKCNFPLSKADHHAGPPDKGGRGVLRVTSVDLMQSVLSSKGPAYSVVEKFIIAGENNK